MQFLTSLVTVFPLKRILQEFFVSLRFALKLIHDLMRKSDSYPAHIEAGSSYD